MAACGMAGAAMAASWGDNADPATSGTTFQQSKEACRGLQSRSLPAADAPDAAAAASLGGCSSEAFYFGIGVPADAAKARQCAYLEMTKGDDGGPGSAAPGFSGAAMLMTIYANGRGATQDFDIASMFACRLDGAPAEMVYRIMHLQQMKRDKPQVTDFSWCDDITSGIADSDCTAHDRRIQVALRDAQVSALASRWKGAAAQAFAVLRKASAAFIETRTRNEVDQSGASRGSYRTNEANALQKEFADRLTSLAAGHPPMYSRNEIRDAEARLSTVFNGIQGNQDFFGFGTVDQAGIRETQDAWLAYRDAWVDFMRKTFPRANADFMKTWLTLKRIDELTVFQEPGG
jgi:uncharacterized protein YecT (DUF1311 family)